MNSVIKTRFSSLFIGNYFTFEEKKRSINPTYITVAHPSSLCDNRRSPVKKMMDEVEDQAAHVSISRRSFFHANNMVNFCFHLPTSGTMRV